MKKNLTTLIIQVFLFLIIQGFLVFLMYKILPFYMHDFEEGSDLSYFGYLVELSLLLIAFIFFLSITCRFSYGILLTNILYFFFIISGALKIDILKAPVVLYDLYQIDDLLININVLSSQTIGILIILFACVVYLLFRGFAIKSNRQYRLITLAILMFCVIFGFTTVTPAKELFKKHKIKYKWNSDIIAKTQKHGFLTIFLESIYFSTQLRKPDNYSKEQVLSWLEDFKEIELFKFQNVLTNPVPNNVIVLMVESFQDPDDLPWKAEGTIVPTYKLMQETGFSSHLISPVFGGKSVNAEFELLTGFSHIFLPQGAIPYKDFVHQKIPSLAWQMRKNGYSTNVVQVVKMLGYGYETIYDYLGFENKFSLNSKTSDIKLDPTGRYGSSEAVGKKIIELLDQQDKSFIFAFPNSTHAPWKISDYPGNQFRLINESLSETEAVEILAYYNALNHVDVLFSKLYHWSQQNTNEKTLIFIVGDHKPALKAWANSKTSKTEHYTVPYLVWTNYPIDVSGIPNTLSSMNLIGGIILQLTNINITGFYKFHAVLRDYFQVFSFEMIEKSNKSLRLNDVNIFDIYESLQYFFLSN